MKLYPLALFLLVLCACHHPTPALSQEETPPTVVIVVRHAERGTLPADDPPLSPAGQARTLELVEATSGADIGAVYTTQYRRTRETALPLATKAGIETTVIPVTGANMASYDSLVAADILAKHRGKTVVVVGHSNTVPAIVAALGGRADITLGESQYDRMFIVVIAEEKTPQTIAVRYGAKTD